MGASPAHHLPEAVLRPVRGHHAFESCVEQLATTIRLGVYPLGSTLPSERELATGSTCPGRPCARRWRRCARPDWSRPGAAAAAAPWSP